MSEKRTDIDYELIFQLMPGVCILLDTKFNIIAQNAAHAEATQTKTKDVLGRGVFEVFPDNPALSGATGVSALRKSLLTAMRNKKTEVLPMQRYDVRSPSGQYETRYWSISNTPVLGDDGYVRWIIIRAEDVTELVRLRAELEQ